MADSGGASISLGKSDLSELAVRLKARNPWERNGDVIFVEDFEDGVDGYQTIFDAPVWSSVTKASGGFSCRFPLIAPNYRSYLWKRLPPFMIQHQFCGIQCEFCFDNHPNNFFHVQLGYNVNTRFHLMYIEFAPLGAGYNIFYGPKNTIVTANAPYLQAQDHYWHVVKLVGDFVNDRYLRMILDGYVIDLSSYPLYTALQSTEAFAFGDINFQARNSVNATSSVWLDNIILTINEPEVLT